MAYTGSRAFCAQDTALGIRFDVAITPGSQSAPEQPYVPFLPGTKVAGTLASTWVLCTAGGTINQDDFVIIQGPGDTGAPADFTAVQLSNTNARGKLGALVGIAGASATVGQLVWVMRDGLGVSPNFGTPTAYAQLHSTATAGQLSSTSSTGTSVAINGVVSNGGTLSGGLQAWCAGILVGAND